MIMIDPKRVELTLYQNIPHLLTPVIKAAKQAVLSLKWAVKEMERRYDILESYSVQNIASYHKNILEPSLKENDSENSVERMPYIVIIIDEMSDLMQSFPKELEAAIVRLAQMSRAVGIHLILSTQRPSVNVITGLIKANVPGRIALRVSSQIDSRTIMDTGGAEKLLGAGDMLFTGNESARPIRIQSAYATEEEVKEVVAFIIKNNEADLGLPLFSTSTAVQDDPDAPAQVSHEFTDDDDDDDLYDDAKQAVIQAGKASTSYLQRKLRVGYSRAARLMDILETRGVIGPQDGAKPRSIIGVSSSSNNSQGLRADMRDFGGDTEHGEKDEYGDE